MIIFSLDLTDIDTLNMCRGLRATGDAHIIAMARRCDKDTTDLALAAGADEVLAKPSSGRSMAARTVPFFAFIWRRAGQRHPRAS